MRTPPLRPETQRRGGREGSARGAVGRWALERETAEGLCGEEEEEEE